MDKIEIQYKAQEGGFRFWVMSINPKCMSAGCQEIKTGYAIDRTNCLRRCSELADYHKDELGNRASIKEIS